jgi:hypothetical protein
MGFRFSRRIKIAPGVRLNVSQSGLSTSVGRKGAWMTFGSKGTRSTVGIPGTGLSYTETRRGGARVAGLVTAVIVLGVLLFAFLF